MAKDVINHAYITKLLQKKHTKKPKTPKRQVLESFRLVQISVCWENGAPPTPRGQELLHQTLPDLALRTSPSGCPLCLSIFYNRLMNRKSNVSLSPTALFRTGQQQPERLTNGGIGEPCFILCCDVSNASSQSMILPIGLDSSSFFCCFFFTSLHPIKE